MSQSTTTEKTGERSEQVVTKPRRFAVSALWGDRIGALVAIVLGVIAIREAVRLYPHGMNAFTGDHLMPAVVGVALVVLGVAALFSFKQRDYRIRGHLPRGQEAEDDPLDSWTICLLVAGCRSWLYCLQPF